MLEKRCIELLYLDKISRVLQTRHTEGPDCELVLGHDVSLHLGTHLNVVRIVSILLRGYPVAIRSAKR
jgi:hypothetical protein